MIRSIALSLLLVLAACGSTTLDNSGGGLTPTVAKIVIRHNAWVLADTALTPQIQDGYLAQSKALDVAFRANQIEVPPIYDVAIAVLNRHDAYAVAVPESDPLDMVESRTVRLEIEAASGQ